MSDRDLAALARLAERAGRYAGELLRSRPQTVRHKGDIDLVTEVDLASEARIRETLLRHEPSLPVQGEEQGGQAHGLRWVVDPLDGTTNFVHGYPAWTVSIALVDGDRPLAGCIYDPLRDQAATGWRGGGAWVGDTQLRVSEIRSLNDALAVTGFPYDRRAHAPTYLRYVEAVLKATQGMRRSGSAAFDLVTVARGQVDFFWEFGLKAWDTSAGVVLVEEAGGRISRLDGAPHTPGAPDILATNAWLYDDVLKLLSLGDGRWDSP